MLSYSEPFGECKQAAIALFRAIARNQCDKRDYRYNYCCNN